MQKSSTGISAHPFLQNGFRPFFLLGALYSVTNLLIWGGFFAGHRPPPAFLLDPVSWHAHEMIFGFTIAIVAGFLLTAVANWTGRNPAGPMHLAGLSLLWLAGRVVMHFDLGLPEMAIFLVEGSFILALALTLSLPLLKSWNQRNFVFLVLLTILLACDMTFLVTKEFTSLYVAVMIVVAMISLIGGRVIPSFTVAALHQRGKKAKQVAQERLDISAILSLVLIILALVFTGPEGMFLAVVSFLSATLHALRMRHYHTHRILGDPMALILHIGYGWVIAGLILTGFSALGTLPFQISLHALTAGAIGSMTLGMMSRVPLAHTGRTVRATRLTILSFILLQGSALMRVLGPIMNPDNTVNWIMGSATLWAFCFAFYILAYAPILWKPELERRAA
ncbi:NnrS family protein [Nitrospina watsonii]|uniref:NnrS protein involved in response to NO n=1 Tax=Nitrospina watsonii TaxID=1323948 RepID=A0ABM9HF91_9BACT|nr:NnrS family protein [Nitrospina watsonii]CAI2718693.1 NnrS protein involved in response to NO [Nitrospina watsonii]